MYVYKHFSMKRYKVKLVNEPQVDWEEIGMASF